MWAICTLPSLAIMLGVGAGPVPVAASRRPLVDGHHTMVNVPGHEQRLPDTQRERDRFLPRVGRPPRLSRRAETRIDLHCKSVELEFALAAVWAADDAVQHIPRVAAQVRCLPRPGHGTDEPSAVHDARLDRADPGRP